MNIRAWVILLINVYLISNATYLRIWNVFAKIMPCIWVMHQALCAALFYINITQWMLPMQLPTHSGHSGFLCYHRGDKVASWIPWSLAQCIPMPDYNKPLHLDVVDRYLRRMGDKTIPDEAPPGLESLHPPWVSHNQGVVDFCLVHQ